MGDWSVLETTLAKALKIKSIQSRQRTFFFFFLIYFAIFGWEEGSSLKNVNILKPFFLQNALLLGRLLCEQNETLLSAEAKAQAEALQFRSCFTAFTPSHLWANFNHKPESLQHWPLSEFLSRIKPKPLMIEKIKTLTLTPTILRGKSEDPNGKFLPGSMDANYIPCARS